MPATAIIGAGFIGPVHVEALRRLGRPVAGILASTPQKGQEAAQRLGLPRCYAHLDELLSDPAVGAVHIASPNRHHFEQARQTLAAGKHVLCEKPLAMDSHESAQLVALAAERKQIAAVCYNVRYYPLCLEARERIRGGELGEIYHVGGSYVQDWLLHDTDFNWRVLADEGGRLRAVADIGTHFLDLIQHITGLTVTRLCADLKTALPVRRRPRGSVETFQSKLKTAQQLEAIPIDTEDYASLLLRFDGGAAGVCTVSQVTAGRKNCLRFEIAGARGSLAWNSERPNELWRGHRDRPNELLVRDPALVSPVVRPYTDYPGGHNEGFPDTFKQLFRAVYHAMDTADAGNARASRQAFPTFADGHREILLCEAVLRSHQESSWANVVG